MNTKRHSDKEGSKISIWLGFTVIMSLCVFIFLFKNYQESILPIGLWIIASILAGTGLHNLLVTSERIKYVNRLLGVWLLFGSFFIFHGAKEQSVLRQLNDAKGTAAGYRDSLKNEIEIPVKSGHPWQVHQSLLTTDRVDSVELLGINSLTVIHGHRNDLQRIIDQGGSVKILLLHPDSDAFNEKEAEEGKPAWPGKRVNRIRKEWEASIAILRDILIKLEANYRMRDLEERFELRLHQREVDRSLFFVNKCEDELSQTGETTKIDKKYLLLKPYRNSKKGDGQASLSILVDDKWTEYADNKKYFDEIWCASNTVEFNLGDLEGVGEYPTIGKSEIVTQFKKLSKSTTWKLVKEIKMNFRTHHPQGMVKIDDYIYFSTVEVVEWPEQRPSGGYDRTPGKGIAHLCKADLEGNLVDSIKLGEKNIYHPGGIGYDGKYIWVPVAEYRPNSKSMIYRIEAADNTGHMKIDEMFRFNDHIGDIIHDKRAGELHGVNWGSRWFYSWKLDEELKPIEPLNPMKVVNGNHYVDYQDCHYVPYGYMLCAGLNKYDIDGDGQENYAFGGIDLLDNLSLKAIHQIPVPKWVSPNLVMSHNPFYFELEDEHLRFYFMPEDDESTVYVYDTLN